MIEVHVDVRQLNNIRMGFLKLDSGNRGAMNIFEFEKKLVKTFLATCPQQQIRQFVNIVRDQKNESMINFQRLSSFIDLFQYFPYVIKKDKNFSEDVYFALSSNKAGNAMTILNDTLNSLSARQTDIKILLDYFWLKIQTKFSQVASSFRFFDFNSDGQISYNQFCVGLQNLNMKLSKQNSLKIFNYIDKAKSGFISYFQFCQLCQERRRGIDPYQPLPGHVQNLQKQKLNAKVGVHRSFYKSEDGDQPIISTQLQAYKNLRVKKLPEKLNPKSFTFGRKTKQSDDIAPILNNEYAEKWLQKQKLKEEQYLNSQIGSHVASSLTSGSKKLRVFKHFHTKASRGMKQTQLKKFKEQERSMEEQKLKMYLRTPRIHSRTIDSSYSFLGGDSSFGGVSQKGAHKRQQTNPYQLPIVKKSGLYSDKKKDINQSFNNYEYPKLSQSRDDGKASISVPPINQNQFKKRKIRKIEQIQEEPVQRRILTSMNTPQQQKMKSLVRGIYTPSPATFKNGLQNDLLSKKKMMMIQRQAQSVDIRKKSSQKVDPRSLFKQKQSPIIEKMERQDSTSYVTDQMSKLSTKRRSQTAYMMMSQTANSFNNSGSFLKQQNAL